MGRVAQLSSEIRGEAIQEFRSQESGVSSQEKEALLVQVNSAGQIGGQYRGVISER